MLALSTVTGLGLSLCLSNSHVEQRQTLRHTREQKALVQGQSHPTAALMEFTQQALHFPALPFTCFSTRGCNF